MDGAGQERLDRPVQIMGALSLTGLALMMFVFGDETGYPLSTDKL